MGKIMKKQFLSIFIACVFILYFLSSVLYKAEEIPSMYSGAYALIDGTTGRLLLGKNEEVAMANASTTKILTCIVTLENCDMDEMVTISSNAQNQPKVRLGMGEGEQYPLIDLLYGLMLESYNDCAVAIAEHVAGSVEEFAVLLNEKAKNLGCQDTYFITPNGLDLENEGGFHHTTALDLCNMMAYCTWESPKKDLFLQITQTMSYQGTNGKNNYSFSNKNTLLSSMEGVLSGKTGFTSKAGYCYVAALEENGERYCIALLACGWPNNKTYKWQDAKALFRYGLDNYDMVTVKRDKVEEQIIVDGYINRPVFSDLNDQMYVIAEGVCEETQILVSKDEKITKKVSINSEIGLPIQKGMTLGTCTYYIGDYVIKTLPLTAKEGAKEWNFMDVFECIVRRFIHF